MLMQWLIILQVIISLLFIESVTTNERTESILSRKRRYLIFPSGSSFQMVYDQIIPVVDYTNLFILGVTTALAWELPDSPTYIDQRLQEQYKNGTLPLLHRNDLNVTDEESNVNYDIITYNANDELNRNNIKSINNQGQSFKDEYYFNRRFYNRPILSTNHQYNKFQSLSTRQHSPWKDAQWKVQSKQYPSSGSYRFNWLPTKKHIVYPALGKRSTDSSSKQSLDELFYQHHHRSTRHNLYRVVEKYLGAHGKNGEECVRKALCETGQKRNENEPGSFIGEIMRAVFSIPLPTLGDVKDSKHKMYDEAFFSQQNCTELYSKCPDSMWTADFIF